MDLLAHEVLVRAELVVADFGLHGGGHLAGIAAAPVLLIQRGGAVVSGAHRRDLRVVQVDHLLGVPDQGGHVGGDEHLGFADAQHDRAAVAGHHELVRLLGVQHHQPVGAFHVAQRAADRILKAQPAGLFAHLGRDQVRQGLGVGVTDQLDAPGHQGIPELLGILDDPVVDHRDAAVGVGMRMGVDLVRLPVGGPPGVADADRRLRPVADPLPQVLDAAGGLGDLQLVPVDDRQSGRVVAPVLQAPQSLENDRDGVPAADVSYDSAHVKGLLCVGVSSPR